MRVSSAGASADASAGVSAGTSAGASAGASAVVELLNIHCPFERVSMTFGDELSDTLDQTHLIRPIASGHRLVTSGNFNCPGSSLDPGSSSGFRPEAVEHIQSLRINVTRDHKFT